MTPDRALVAYRYSIPPHVVEQWPQAVVDVFARRLTTQTRTQP